MVPHGPVRVRHQREPITPFNREASEATGGASSRGQKAWGPLTPRLSRGLPQGWPHPGPRRAPPSTPSPPHTPQGPLSLLGAHGHSPHPESWRPTTAWTPAWLYPCPAAGPPASKAPGLPPTLNRWGGGGVGRGSPQGSRLQGRPAAGQGGWDVGLRSQRAPRTWEEGRRAPPPRGRALGPAVGRTVPRAL